MTSGRLILISAMGGYFQEDSMDAQSGSHVCAFSAPSRETYGGGSQVLICVPLSQLNISRLSVMLGWRAVAVERDNKYW